MGVPMYVGRGVVSREPQAPKAALRVLSMRPDGARDVELRWPPRFELGGRHAPPMGANRPVSSARRHTRASVDQKPSVMTLRCCARARLAAVGMQTVHTMLSLWANSTFSYRPHRRPPPPILPPPRPHRRANNPRVFHPLAAQALPRVQILSKAFGAAWPGVSPPTLPAGARRAGAPRRAAGRARAQLLRRSRARDVQGSVDAARLPAGHRPHHGRIHSTRREAGVLPRARRELFAGAAS